jgi:hypothetical protein
VSTPDLRNKDKTRGEELFPEPTKVEAAGERKNKSIEREQNENDFCCSRHI